MQLVKTRGLVEGDQATSLSLLQTMELEGLVTGAWVCPDIILAEDWIDEITGNEGRPEPIAPGLGEDELTLVVFGTFNKVSQSLRSLHSYKPIFAHWPKPDLVSLYWAYGFMRAVRLRPHSFVLFETSPKTRKAWKSMTRFMVASTQQFTDEERKRSVEEAHLHAGDWIRALMEWSLKHRKRHGVG